MENKDKRIIFLSVVSSLIVFLSLIFLGGLFLWFNKGTVFNNFAQSYLEGRLVSQEETQTAPVLGQEWYVTSAVKKAGPAVVAIAITRKVPVINNTPGGNPFGNFWNFNLPFVPDYEIESREVGGGSGFFVSSDGYIITNEHVVSSSEAEYTVVTQEGKRYAAKVVAKDPALDIAVLKIPGTNYPYLEFGDSDRLQVGQSVIAIGNALAEFRNTVSVGVVSGLSRSVVAGDEFGRMETLDEVIQTDAAINPGNSGGPLLNLQGKVVGVNVAMVGGSQNINFALPGNSIKDILASIRRVGKIVRPYLGVQYVSVDPQLKERENLPFDYGVLISSGNAANQSAVIAGSPAASAGLKNGDVILELEGQKIGEDKSLASLIRERKVGDKVVLKVWRAGQTLEISVVLGQLPDRARQ